MTRRKLTKEQKLAVRDKVSAASLDFMDQHGKWPSIREISGGVGIPPMSLYTYYENKGELICSIAKRVLVCAHPTENAVKALKTLPIGHELAPEIIKRFCVYD